jgi:uncharacterized protein YuzE
MKVKYDKEADVLYIQLSNEAVSESDEDKRGVVIDYDASGKVVGIEILNASKSLPQPNIVEYEVA